MKQIKEFTGENARLDMLQDTINYYWGKPERKCMVDEICKYSATEQSDGCAIGRYLSDEDCKEFDRRSDGNTVNYVFNQLPQWMQDLKLQFLENLQGLHDFDSFVNKDKPRIILYMKDFIPNIDQIQFPNE